MDVGSVSGTAAQSSALSAANTQVAVQLNALSDAMDAQGAALLSLLESMGLGQNLDVVA